MRLTSLSLLLVLAAPIACAAPSESVDESTGAATAQDSSPVPEQINLNVPAGGTKTVKFSVTASDIDEHRVVWLATNNMGTPEFTLVAAPGPVCSGRAIDPCSKPTLGKGGKTTDRHLSAPSLGDYEVRVRETSGKAPIQVLVQHAYPFSVGGTTGD